MSINFKCGDIIYSQTALPAHIYRPDSEVKFDIIESGEYTYLTKVDLSDWTFLVLLEEVCGRRAAVLVPSTYSSDFIVRKVHTPLPEEVLFREYTYKSYDVPDHACVVPFRFVDLGQSMLPVIQCVTVRRNLALPVHFYSLEENTFHKQLQRKNTTTVSDSCDHDVATYQGFNLPMDQWYKFCRKCGVKVS